MRGRLNRLAAVMRFGVLIAVPVKDCEKRSIVYFCNNDSSGVSGISVIGGIGWVATAVSAVKRRYEVGTKEGGVFLLRLIG